MTAEELKKEIFGEAFLKILEQLPEADRGKIQKELEDMVLKYHSAILEPLQKTYVE